MGKDGGTVLWGGGGDWRIGCCQKKERQSKNTCWEGGNSTPTRVVFLSLPSIAASIDRYLFAHRLKNCSLKNIESTPPRIQNAVEVERQVASIATSSIVHREEHKEQKGGAGNGCRPKTGD
jgi:hypothetical protein